VWIWLTGSNAFVNFHGQEQLARHDSTHVSQTNARMEHAILPPTSKTSLVLVNSVTQADFVTKTSTSVQFLHLVETGAFVGIPMDLTLASVPRDTKVAIVLRTPMTALSLLV